MLCDSNHLSTAWTHLLERSRGHNSCVTGKLTWGVVRVSRLWAKQQNGVRSRVVKIYRRHERQLKQMEAGRIQLQQDHMKLCVQSIAVSVGGLAPHIWHWLVSILPHVIVQDQVQSIHQLLGDLFQRLQAKRRNIKSLDKHRQGFNI